MQKTHPNISLFIDSIRNEVPTVHDLITQINSGTRPREKKTQSKIAEGRIKVSYGRFNNKKIKIESLLQELSFFVVHQKKL